MFLALGSAVPGLRSATLAEAAVSLPKGEGEPRKRSSDPGLPRSPPPVPGRSRALTGTALLPQAFAGSPKGSNAPEPGICLTGGVVAYREERTLARAVRSLLAQDLPAGTRWDTVWVVVSDGGDRTIEEAVSLAREDPRVRLVIEPDRGGKARALGEVLRRAEGSALVLLNADAIASAGAVAELLRSAAGRSRPYAVMARPTVPAENGGPWEGPVRAMWDLHHRFHLLLSGYGGGAHLSDELLLLSVPELPPLPEGTINDGSYFGAWLARIGGARVYAPSAEVVVAPARTVQDHLHQRRRIHFGNAQVARLLGVPPTTLTRFARDHPRAALELLRSRDRSAPFPFRHLVALGLAELGAKLLALWDRLLPQVDHVRWRRIAPFPRPDPRPPGSEPPGGPDVPGPLDGPTEVGPEAVVQRFTLLLEIAGRFGTGIRCDDLLSLLPPGAPRTRAELGSWVESHPGLARLEGDRVFRTGTKGTSLVEREARGLWYRGAARALAEGELSPLRRWVRCLGVTGSTAYGEPEGGDDLDLFVVTRTGATWVALAAAYLLLHRRSSLARSGAPAPCFNYVLDDRTAVEEFSRARGFLFAREALTAEMIWGDRFYRALLARAPWIRSEFPRRFDERCGSGPVEEARPAGLGVRALNLVLYPLVATYLQLQGLRRNAHLAAAGRTSAVFRTETRIGRLLYRSQRFEHLGAACALGPTSSQDLPAPDGILAAFAPGPTSGRGEGM